ncbi:hypothetical protein SAY86_027654 [Trapa natans]|uniref:Kinesin-like protein n=1 Tax=Trapa natans TaxID=22666 RepID=A0AAN7QJF0_TRANT|nr:hypothetical protein SAY86_027654 [Trapa natans]
MSGAPATPLTKMQRAFLSTPGGSRACEENIRVTVRIRPLSRREQAMYDLIAWECMDRSTIIYKNPNQERVTSPFVFDRVFDPSCSTQTVYEEGAKEVALSALKGINSTVFAYGQTSSGKTYTMRGITENAIKDIYEYIQENPDKEFVLKLSALEIYNEHVRDLLNLESGSLRLLDDPEKGTIVEKLVEEVVKGRQHLQQLISICEAQRQVGETVLNDKSSRSHQIIRLTIQSSITEDSGCIKSFIASLNLVDLAGSERASQTNAGGTRLKEGSHINRSLLTLMNVIRKLSVEKRGSHIPYRDSKLTRILQHSLGGNARTAMICTASPALSHIEQTKNTLSFATSAKEVTNRAQVNMVEPDKRLVKHLQKEVARLEAELRCPDLSSSHLRSLLKEKDMKILEMEKEMKQLKRERDLAQSQLESERKTYKGVEGLNQDEYSDHVVRRLAFEIDPSFSVRSTPANSKLRSTIARKTVLRQSVTSTDPSLLVSEIRKLDERQRQLEEEASRVLEILHKEIASHRIGDQEAAENIVKLLSEIKDMKVAGSFQEVVTADKANLQEEISRLNCQGNDILSLERKLENVQETIDKLVSAFQMTVEDPSEYRSPKKKKGLPFNLSNSPNIIRAPCSPLSSSRKAMDHETENMDPKNRISISYKESPSRSNGTPIMKQSKSINVKKMERMFKTAAEENIRSIKAYVTELKERVAKLQYQKQLLVCQVLELEKNESPDEADMIDQPPMPWPLLFEDQRKQIIMLWHLCHVPIIHRTQFYLLFQGDLSDQIYMEVELRRLTWLEQHFAELGNASPALLGDDPAGSVSSSIKALREERDYLAKRVSSKLTAEERERLYEKWEIPPGGKQRRLQLVSKLWTDPLNMHNVQESAEVVAKLVGFCESGEQVRKEMFQLNFVSPNDRKPWTMGWNLISNLLHR